MMVNLSAIMFWFRIYYNPYHPGWMPKGQGRLFFREKSEEFCIDLVDHLLEILRAVLELDAVYVKNKQIVLIVLDPVLVALVQTGDIIDTDALLILAAPLLNLADEIRNGTAEIDKQVRRIHERHHKVEKIGIILEIPCAHKPHTVKVRRKDTCVFIDGAVLDDDIVLLGDIHNILEPLVEEINLKIE